jgi:hypothetical protein
MRVAYRFATVDRCCWWVAMRLSKLFLHIACIMAIYTASFAAWANEPLYRKTQVQAIRHAFVAKKFDHLESLHQRYLQNGTRTPSGIWELSLLHEGLQLPITNKAGTPIQDGSEFDRHFDEWLTAHPRSEVAHLARVQRYIARFEDILRSVGNATPTMDQLRLLREQLDNAEIYIARHRPREAKDPHWDVLNLIMANWRGLDRDSFDRMLREALARHPPIMISISKPAFTTLITLTTHSPRWTRWRERARCARRRQTALAFMRGSFGQRLVRSGT